MKNNYIVNRLPYKIAPKGSNLSPRRIFSIMEVGKICEVSLADISNMEIHYNAAPEHWNKNTVCVNVATCQRAGTWLHKHFFKFYADAFSNVQLHIGPKLANPFLSRDLNTLFFVGHFPYPHSRKVVEVDSAKTNKI